MTHCCDCGARRESGDSHLCEPMYERLVLAAKAAVIAFGSDSEGEAIRHLGEVIASQLYPTRDPRKTGGRRIAMRTCPNCGEPQTADSDYGYINYACGSFSHASGKHLETTSACGRISELCQQLTARNTDFAALAERLEKLQAEKREIVSVVRSLVMRPYMSRHQAIVDAEGRAMAILKRYEETEADHD